MLNSDVCLKVLHHQNVLERGQNLLQNGTLNFEFKQVKSIVLQSYKFTLVKNKLVSRQFRTLELVEMWQPCQVLLYGWPTKCGTLHQNLILEKYQPIKAIPFPSETLNVCVLAMQIQIVKCVCANLLLQSDDVTDLRKENNKNLP